MWCMTLKCRTAVPADSPFSSVSPRYQRCNGGAVHFPDKQVAQSRPDAVRECFSRGHWISSCLPYCSQYRSISADIRKLTSRLISKCRFSSRADIFLRQIFFASSCDPCTADASVPPSFPPTDLVDLRRVLCELTSVTFSFQSMVSIVCCSTKRSSAIRRTATLDQP